MSDGSASQQELASSDDARSAAQSEHLQVCKLRGEFRLESGTVIPEVEVAFETWGQLNRDRSNAVLVCHAVSGDSHAASHGQGDLPGWWELVVGPKKAIDTDRFFVICANVLGGCRGTTGPSSLNPQTGRRWGGAFPLITLADIVDVHARLLDELGILRLHAVVGGSMGGHQALVFSLRHPRRVARTAMLASSARLTAQALAFDVVARNAILRDPHFRNGDYYDQPLQPTTGLALARMLGHITYLSRDAMTSKFDPTRLTPRQIDTTFEKLFSVGSYLAYQGKRFVERFDANTYITLTRAMDLLDLGGDPSALEASLEPAESRFLLVGFTSDWLFPPDQSRQIADALIRRRKPVTFCNIRSGCGHDAFLLPDDLAMYGGLLEAFLSEPTGQGSVAPRATASGRPDDELVLQLVPSGASVLDLGCGDGHLLARLSARGAGRLLGVELDESAVLATARRGLDVVQHDLEMPLDAFPDRGFDYVILSQTLQAIRRTEGLIRDMLRIGRRAIVTMSNFAYREMRQMLADEGRAPRGPGLLQHEWHNTPNVRFASILDFEEFCAARGIRVCERIGLHGPSGRVIRQDPNLDADLAVFVLESVEESRA
jgi:homoserine O-acetyltransferase